MSNQTNDKLTNERLDLIRAETIGVSAARGDGASVEVNAALFVSVLTELQEYRKADEPTNDERIMEIEGVTVPTKEHELRELVNELRDVAVKYRDTQQLREHIAKALRAAAPQQEVK